MGTTIAKYSWWTEKEISILTKYYKQGGQEKAMIELTAAGFSRTKNAVKTKAFMLGLEHKRKKNMINVDKLKKLSPYVKRMIKKYYPKYGAQACIDHVMNFAMGEINEDEVKYLFRETKKKN